MRWVAAACAILALLMLGGCAGPRARPAKAGGAGGGGTTGLPATATTSAAAGSAATAGGIHDDLNLPQSERYRLQHDTGPDGAHVDISTLPEPVPHPEPRSQYGNTSPYTVDGHTYHVLRSADGYDRRGIASWYGRKFNGYMTSSLERYDMYKFTAASKTLPLPTWARVTNLANGKSVIVRVNDRGPFVSDRIIDLSYAAAVRIGIWPKGTGRVEVKAIDPAHPQELQASHTVSKPGRHGIWLQVGAFADRGNAARVARRLRRADIGPVQVESAQVDGRHVSRVRLGPFADSTKADRASDAVIRLGLPAPRVAVD